jgi:hypothetical protein
MVILKLVPNGQAERLGLAVGMQITHLAGSRTKTSEEFNALKDQMVDDEVRFLWFSWYSRLQIFGGCMYGLENHQCVFFFCFVGIPF